MKELPVRKSIRLRGYDYSQNGAYFVTVCVKGRHEILGQITVGAAHLGGPHTAHLGGPHTAHLGGPHVKLSESGEMVKYHVETINNMYPNICVEKYVIMPNHVHLLVFITDGLCVKDGPPRCAAPTKTVLAKTINAFKSLTSRQFGETMWQRSYHDHIIRNEEEYRKIWQYIDENPANWAEDCYFAL